MVIERVFEKAFALCLGAWACGCSTDAVAIEQCREIEHARCEASAVCGVVGDVEECKRTYNDQCLHGIAGPKAPTSQQQDDCISLIEDAGETATESDSESAEYAAACDIISEPWERSECEYLLPAMGGASGDDDEEDDDE